MALPSPSVAAVAAGAQGDGRRGRFEVADVVRSYGEEYLRTHRSTGEQRRVLRAIVRCRTPMLGGHRQQCDGCGRERVAYNSCRDRHCPKCQGKERARWMAAEQAMLLPVPYFHVVFTLPHALHALVRANRRRLYGLLFRAAAATLATFARDPRHLGAAPAVTMVLHTWGQTLTAHYHVHCVVSGGGLSLDGTSWISLPKGKKKRRRLFLFPVAALSHLFRGTFLTALERARNRGDLRFAGESAPFADRVPWQVLIDRLRSTPWVVYAKAPFDGPETVLKYLSRYTHRVAISNRRILFVGDGVVRFQYRDYADHSRSKEMTLQGTEFLRRFLLHVVPSGFMRIRHYGITANCHRREKLACCRDLLGRAEPPRGSEPHTAVAEAGDDDTVPCDSDAARCPSCGAPMRVVEIIPPVSAPHDTS